MMCCSLHFSSSNYPYRFSCCFFYLFIRLGSFLLVSFFLSPLSLPPLILPLSSSLPPFPSSSALFLGILFRFAFFPSLHLHSNVSMHVSLSVCGAHEQVCSRACACVCVFCLSLRVFVSVFACVCGFSLVCLCCFVLCYVVSWLFGMR